MVMYAPRKTANNVVLLIITQHLVDTDEREIWNQDEKMDRALVMVIFNEVYFVTGWRFFVYAILMIHYMIMQHCSCQVGFWGIGLTVWGERKKTGVGWMAVTHTSVMAL